MTHPPTDPPSDQPSDPYAPPPAGAPVVAEQPWRPRDLPWSRRALAVGPLAVLTAILAFSTAWSALSLLMDLLVMSAIEDDEFFDGIEAIEPGVLERAAPVVALLLLFGLAALAAYALFRAQRRLRVAPEGLLPWAALGVVLGIVSGIFVSAAAGWAVEELVYLVTDGGPYEDEHPFPGQALVARPSGSAYRN